MKKFCKIGIVIVVLLSLQVFAGEISKKDMKTLEKTYKCKFMTGSAVTMNIESRDENDKLREVWYRKLSTKPASEIPCSQPYLRSDFRVGAGKFIGNQPWWGVEFYLALTKKGYVGFTSKDNKIIKF